MLVHVRQDTSIQIQGDVNVAVAQAFAYHLWVLACLQRQSREGLAVSLDKPQGWAVGFFFGNTDISLEFWTVIAGISGFDD